MKKINKMICIISIAALLLASVSGCTDNTAEKEDFSLEGVFEKMQELLGINGADEDDWIYAASGIKGDAVMLTVDGEDVTAEEYFYFLMSSVDYLQYYYFYYSDIDWSETIDGMTVADYVKYDALETIKLYHAVSGNAASLGFSLTEEDVEAVAELRQQTIDSFGGEEEYNVQLKAAYMTDEIYQYLNEVYYLYNNIYEGFYGDGGTRRPTDEEVLAYGGENGYMHAAHILLSFTDSEGNAISDEEKTEKHALAESLLAQLNAGGDTVNLFMNLMAEYREDTGLSQYPTGYHFVSGEMDETFEAAVGALDVNQYSGIVETGFGYHIILRLPLEADSLRETYSGELFDELVSEWRENAEVEYGGKYDAVDVEAFYNAVTEAEEAAAAE